jgi:two-component system phosphate regulon response regulator PhoB
MNRPMLILVIDDDDAARRMMRRALERKGHVVEEASSGAAGMKRMVELGPDVVLLDLRMPGELSGLDVARKASADPATHTIPIIIVSASAHESMREITRELGCAGFVEKPVDFAELHNAIARVARNHA